MAELTITTFLSLEGVMQVPEAPKEDPSGNFSYGGWLVPHADADLGKTALEIFSNADAFLLGRTTYDIFSAHWPRVTDPADLIASKLDSLPKYAATSPRGESAVPDGSRTRAYRHIEKTRSFILPA